MTFEPADIGFDGIDLTVRKGGHVEPSRAAEELPAAVEAIRKTGLEVPMVTTGIITAQSEHAGEILRTISSLGIHDYRWGGFPLDAGRSIPEQIESARGAVRDLAALNQSHRVCAMYHTHSGTGVLGALGRLHGGTLAAGDRGELVEIEDGHARPWFIDRATAVATGGDCGRERPS